jgi:signal transduction histidine kinase
MTDLAPILEGLEPLWGGRLRAAGRQLEVTAPPSLPARATPARAAQALDVLVGNAEAHGAGTVRVTASTADGAVIVEVADEGEVTIGPEVFATRQPGSGHGIGLALARSLAEADGGELTLHHAGPGCSFRLILGSD